MPASLDGDGQPTILGYNENRRINRAINELLGMLRGIVADNDINLFETETLAKWMMANTEVLDIWPVKPLAQRLNRIYEDGVVTDEEREDLKELVNQIVGGQDDKTFLYVPTDLPLTKPAPDVIFNDNEFVLTGKFFYGTRKVCQRQIELLGGRCSDSVRLQTSYLVIGSLISRDWKFTSYGRKIQKAMDYSDRCSIAIVSERHWESFLLHGSRA
ncbi:MAG: BRCT domain-containing protein [Terriglobales bacterium]